MLTDLFGVSGRAMLAALIAGECNPRVLAALARGNLVRQKVALVEALNGQFEVHHGFLCQTLLDSVDHLTAQIARLTEQITAAVRDLPGQEASHPGPSLVERLDQIPGVGVTIAHVLPAELGPDMGAFPTSDHPAS
ncbi:hypothetical protein SGFS_002700 [Streptomyces graminofaciens]|uniref:Transposase n=1 Tax=Streptomyces graminofaciens TaxID=68212 RepID=A0ABM7F0B2_9ACTN|nr:hypothetical protein [Streptomyces graminofaciens]BBC28979.1 hypothetical protein SGFS_002700 [Streptomyces graminofaciens]